HRPAGNGNPRAAHTHVAAFRRLETRLNKDLAHLVSPLSLEPDCRSWRERRQCSLATVAVRSHSSLALRARQIWPAGRPFPSALRPPSFSAGCHRESHIPVAAACARQRGASGPTGGTRLLTSTQTVFGRWRSSAHRFRYSGSAGAPASP